VLNEIVRRARQSGGRAVGGEFEPTSSAHPAPDSGIETAHPRYPRKLRLLEGTGIDAVVILPFGRSSLMTAASLPNVILKKRNYTRVGARRLQFRFGHKAAGDVNLLAQFGQEMGLSEESILSRSARRAGFQ